MIVVSFLAGMTSALTSTVIVDSIIAGAGLGMSIYNCSKGVKQAQRRGNGTRRAGRKCC